MAAHLRYLSLLLLSGCLCGMRLCLLGSASPASHTGFSALSHLIQPLPPGPCEAAEAVKRHGDQKRPFMVAEVGSESFPGLQSVTEIYLDGRVRVKVVLNDVSLVPEECFSPDGLQFHVHDFWRTPEALSTDSMSPDPSKMLTKDWGIGSKACGPANTGGHWDPTIACSPLTGNRYCASKGGIVPPSSGDSGITDPDSDYKCSPEAFMKNPFLCEVGDFSSKFGPLKLQKEHRKNNGKQSLVSWVDHQDTIPFSSSSSISTNSNPRKTHIEGNSGNSNTTGNEHRHFWISQSDLEDDLSVNGDPHDDSSVRTEMINEPHRIRGPDGQPAEDVENIGDLDSEIFYVGEKEFYDPFMSWPCLLEGRSMVFHCSTGKRVFCAKFFLVQETM